MVLIDTSVWITHLKKGLPDLQSLLYDSGVVCHSFVIGEIACGGIKNRKEIISLLQALPDSPIVSNEEFMFFLDTHKLSDKGIGFVDVHLLASAKLSKIPLWTEDKNLRIAAQSLSLSFS